MTLTEEGSATPPKDLNASVVNYQTELKAVAAQLERDKKTGKLTLELGDKLLQEYVVNLVDVGLRAGFNDISPVPINPKSR